MYPGVISSKDMTMGLSDTGFSAHMRRQRLQRRRLSIVLLAIGALLLVSQQNFHFSFQSRSLLSIEATDIDLADWPPSAIVDAVVDDQNRVVICAVNCAGINFADNWAQSLSSLGVSNFILVPLDNTTSVVLDKAWPGHVVPKLPGPSEESSFYATFGNKWFKELTSTRPSFIKAFVDKGYSVMYNDADMVWKRPIWEEMDVVIPHKSGADAIFVADGVESSLCSCMMYFNPTLNSIRLLGVWRDEIMTDKYNHDQEAFNVVVRMFDSENPNNKEHYELDWIRGDPKKFVAGCNYFRPPHQANAEELRANTWLVHANWMVGMQQKQHRLKETKNWNPSGRLTSRYSCVPKRVETEFERKMNAIVGGRCDPTGCHGTKRSSSSGAQSTSNVAVKHVDELNNPYVDNERQTREASPTDLLVADK